MTAVFKAPFTCIVSGSTSSGKTTFVRQLIKERATMIFPTPTHILYCCTEITAEIMEMRTGGEVEIYFGFPDEEKIRSKTPKLLLVLDDLMLEIENNLKLLQKIFTRGSHHWDVSIIFITQNLYNKELRLLRLNSHYLVLLKNPQGMDQIRNLAHQMYPAKQNYFVEAYNDATNKPFSYLFVDLHPQTEDSLRLSTNIFRKDRRIFYVPSN